MSGQAEIKVIAPKPEKPTPYRPLLSARERRAYVAAHRIMTTDFNFSTLACLSTRRVKMLDMIAAIIQEEMQ